MRSERSFDEALKDAPRVVVMTYNYICPGCDEYKEPFKEVAGTFRGDERIAFARIHIQLRWMIEGAALIGEPKIENEFLAERYGIGRAVPETLFFREGRLVGTAQGVMSMEALTRSIHEFFPEL